MFSGTLYKTAGFGIVQATNTRGRRKLNRFTEKVEGLTESVSDNATHRLNLYKLTAIDKTATVGSWIFSVYLIVAMVDIFVLFLGIAFAYWFGDRFENLPLGFLIAALIFVALQVVFYLMRYQLIGDKMVGTLSDVFFRD